ncbi:AMP-binding protein [Actinomycetospora sp. OC33-EN08]|uniref:AMP-binding protein n=1 Tax=Actinomycetospora aurantiaca TaxID=3129233 RepID=A0ABU8MT76_9PSEU
MLGRLDALRPDTAISLGLLLDESARRAPESPALLYGDRVLRRREVKHRIDGVVAGLLAVGVRPGERVGVLMDSRPSAFCVVAAISRIGACAVLLRTAERDCDREIGLGRAGIVVCDPEHVPSAPPATGRWCVLGGASDERELPGFVTDLETIDPATVHLPGWYRANPTRAADEALVLFSGHGGRTRARVITNRRWALSALGTASAAELDPTHTVYSATPLEHSSSQLMAVAGAIASGARLAFASAPDVETFWSEVRRYGATHVSYAWSSLRDVASGLEHPHERHHSIRIFMGSGMPPNLWRRTVERFAPARVLEFYASADGEAVLANVADRIGSVGRPLPGTARVRIAAFDERTRGIAFDRDGFARECEPGEPGLLLARDDSGAPGPDTLRAVFSADDAWRSTGDLFVRDPTGEYWFIDDADALIRTVDGLVAPARVAQVLQRISGVDTARVVGRDGDVVAAVTLLPGAQLSGWELTSALRRLPAKQRPPTVTVVDPVSFPTPWSRPPDLDGPVDGPTWAHRPDGTYAPTSEDA